MYVRALKLSGFKSFALPTVLEFERGVNVIVGPNGSGKSNIADALSWVMGSQAPSSLRGGSMEDVIFAGSSTHPKLGVAEIELTLDNASGVLGLDLSEVRISRSTDRNGETEYRINGAPCRLLDITELLSDTGIGRSIHTVVGQGQLDAVLHARPEERRDFIEEAAQIGKFRKRKDRALRKIERVEENMVRLNDVLTELRRAIRPLKRQASAAAMYSELMEKHLELRQRLAATEIHRLTAEEARSDPEGEAHRAQLLSDEIESIRARLGSAGSERESLVRAAEGSQETAYGIGRAADRLGGLARLAEERAATISARLAAETEEGYRERIRLLESGRSRWRSELDTLSTRAQEARARAREAAGNLARSRSTVEDAESRLARARAEETAAAEALVRAEGSEAAGRATVDSIESRVRAILERKEVGEEGLAEEGRQVVATESEIQSLEARLDSATEHAAEAEEALEKLRTKAEELTGRLGASHAGRAAADARVQALKDVLQALKDLEGVAPRIEPLLDNAQQAAVVAAVGEEEATAIVAEADAAVEVAWQEVAKRDEELRRLDALVAGAAERLAGARRHREAREIELAALNDELSRAQEALAGAESAAVESRAALPARRAAVEEMRAERADAEGALSSARAAAAEVGAASTDAELEARAAEERSLAAQLRLEEAEAGIADARAALEGLEDLRASLARSHERALAIAGAARLGAEKARGWAADANSRAEAARTAARASDERLTGLRARERELAESLEKVAKRRNEAEVHRAETRARAEALGERAMDEWGMSLDDLRGFASFDSEEEPDAKKEVDRLDREMRRLGAINPRAAEEYAELAERETFLEAQIEDLRGSRTDLMKVVKEVDETIVEVFGQAFEDVAREFEGVFQRLFPGGQGALKLTDPNDLLGSGIEVEARPPGKNVRKLSLLSGGERSLVALAFLFAIFRSRPSPFYLLDEVEAALDDVNLQRFLGLIEELEQTAQVLIVTHQKRTMEAADVLYGVSMNKDGVSRVVAKRLQEVVL